ncbi:MAG: lytic transglycosylase domain-containing protein [Treponema sp.]|nr:lytic transglycosylase domain-containing protein [Treponema sp.]
MRIKDFFAVFYSLLIAGLICLPEFSCAGAGAKSVAGLETPGGESSGAGEPGAEVPASDRAVPLMVSGEADRTDLILEAYRDAASRGRVVDFFGNLTGSRELSAVVLANAEPFDIAPALAFSLCWEESRYNSRAVNRGNRNQTVDRGLFQLNNASFPGLEEQDFFNPSINAWYGLSHLRWCLDTAGTEVAGLAMYNAGTGRVRSGGTPKNTLDYISRILRRQRKIEELFLAENIGVLVEAENGGTEKTAGIRLSLLAPLGRR